MKKIILILLTTIIYSCSSGGGSNAPTETVNLLGTWNYSVITQNSFCDGLEAKGIVTISSLNGDLTKIGDVTSQGEEFKVDDFNNCFFIVLNETDTGFFGEPSEQTSNQYLVLDKNIHAAAGDEIKPIRLDSFTENKIIEISESVDGVIITFTLTR